MQARRGPTLTEALIKIGVPRDRLEPFAARFYEARERQLGEQAVAEGIITRVELFKALAVQARERGDLHEATRWAHEASIAAHKRCVESIDTARAAVFLRASLVRP